MIEKSVNRTESTPSCDIYSTAKLERAQVHLHAMLSIIEQNLMDMEDALKLYDKIKAKTNLEESIGSWEEV